MVLIIIALLFGGYLLFKNADKIRQSLEGMIPRRQVAQIPVDEDDVVGTGLGGGRSRFG